MEQPEAYRAVADELCADPAVSEGLMMGNPALKVGKKMFGGLCEGDLLVKVGRERAQEMFDSGRAEPFDPSGMGRAMGGWARVREPGDDWLALAEEAKAFCADG